MDSSDEFDCNEFIPSEGYDKYSNPPIPTGEHYEIEMAVNITGIKVVELSTFSITINMIHNLRWYDKRLQLRLLKSDYTKVEVYDTIWIPNFYVEDGTSSSVDIETGFEMLRVKKESIGLPNKSNSTIQGKIKECHSMIL